MDKAENPATKKQSVVPWNPWFGIGFAAVVFYASQLFAGVVVMIYPYAQHWSTTRSTDWLNSSTYAQFVYVLLAEAVMLGLLYLYLLRHSSTFKTIGLKRPRWRDPLYGLLAAPAYYVVYLLMVGIVSHYVPGLNVDQHQDIGFSDVHGALQLSLTFISLVVLPPLAEEIMMRGFLYSSLKKIMKIVPAAIATSLIFAALHLPEGGAAGPLYIAALDTFILSLFLVYLREKTGSLWASITLHAIKNGVAFLTLFVIHVK